MHIILPIHLTCLICWFLFLNALLVTVDFYFWNMKWKGHERSLIVLTFNSIYDPISNIAIGAFKIIDSLNFVLFLRVNNIIFSGPRFAKHWQECVFSSRFWPAMLYSSLLWSLFHSHWEGLSCTIYHGFSLRPLLLC